MYVIRHFSYFRNYFINQEKRCENAREYNEKSDPLLILFIPEISAVNQSLF
jgi:hypothetical protein